MRKSIKRDENGYAPCPKCGYKHVGYGNGYNHIARTTTVTTFCYRCEFGFEETISGVPSQCEDEAFYTKLFDAKDKQKESWNKLSEGQQLDGAEKGYGLFRVADELRKTGEMMLKRADKMERQAESLVGRHRNFGRIDTEEEQHGTEQ